MVAAKSKGYTIREIETLFESRLVGQSFIPRVPAMLIYRVLIDIVKAIFEYRISDQRTTVLGEYLRRPAATRSLQTDPVRLETGALQSIYLDNAPPRLVDLA